MKKVNLNAFKNWILAAVIGLAVPAGLWAQTGKIGEKTFSIGPRASYFTPKDADKGEWSGGAQLRLYMTPALALEGSVDYRSNDYGDFVTVKTYPVQASILAYLMPGAVWSPFLLAGGGWYYTEVEIPSIVVKQTKSRFGAHAGAGLEFMLNEYMSIDGTYRLIWLEKLSSQDENALDKEYDDSGSMITIVLNFLF
jgi:opacity protein-like surface antigen